MSSSSDGEAGGGGGGGAAGATPRATPSTNFEPQRQDEQFFETMEEIASTSASSDGGDGEYLRMKQRHSSRGGGAQAHADLPREAKYAVWTSDPASIGERRLKFFSRMGMELNSPSRLTSVPRTMSDPRLGPSGDAECDPFGSADSLTSSSGRNDEADGNTELAEESVSSHSNGEFMCRIKDLDNGKEFVVHELSSDGLWNRVREVGTGRELSLEEFEFELGLSPMVQTRLSSTRSTVTATAVNGNGVTTTSKQKRRSWLRQIRGAVRRTSQRRDENSAVRDDSSEVSSSTGSSRPSPWKMLRVKVRVCKKSVRELTELYMAQELRGHQGPIWALRFSSGGRFLASGGQDCIVRVWKVVIEASPPSECTFEPPTSPRSKKRSSSSAKKRGAEDGAGVGLKTFALGDKSVRSLHGHTEDILDLAWSPSEQFLLSSSMDTTVRLWHVEREECLRIFSHNDYVTCIVFNPADERYFLSGSLDGKVRIWSVLNHHVVDWTDLREIVTAASYTPDGSAAIIGSYKGVCRFYNTTENTLEPNGSIEVVVKKGKNRGKKITGIQCMPGEPSKVLITSNDSRVRLYDGTDLVSKYKGLRNLTSQIAASFSRNGSFIISASEDSHVYVWNVQPPSTASCRGHLQISEKSCENFFSDNVTVAAPWSTQPEEGKDKTAADHRKDIQSRALKIGTELLKQLQLLKQTSFPGPCFDCLAVADSATDGSSTTVFPVSDDSSSFTDADGVLLSPASLGGSEKKMESAPLLLGSDPQKEGASTGNIKGLGLVIVTASITGEIRTFQNYGLPLHA